MASLRRYRVARAAAETLFDDGAGVAAADLDVLVTDLEDFLRHAGWRTTYAIRAGLLVLQYAPFLQGRLRRLTSLSPAARVEVLVVLERSGSLGKLWSGIKLLLSMLWFDGPGARLLPAQPRKTRALEEPIDPWVTTLGPEGPIPPPPDPARAGRRP